MFQLQQLDHIALTVRDVDKSVRWYQNVLGLVRQYEEVWGSFPAVLSVSGTSLGPCGPGEICIRHVAFRTDRGNFDRARNDLAEMGIKIEFQDHEIAHSIYFLDPDGHQLEITTYEV